MKIALMLCFVVLLTACQEAPIKSTKQSSYKIKDLSAKLQAAEKKASPDGRKILLTGRKMALEDRKIVKGSCWDYANAIYNDAGYPNKQKKRQIVFKSKKKSGPYADQDMIKPGDFLYYINHSYHDVEHSAIFIGWDSYEDKRALMLSYAGQNKKTPARYKIYDLCHVYHIIRPGHAKK